MLITEYDRAESDFHYADQIIGEYCRLMRKAFADGKDISGIIWRIDYYILLRDKALVQMNRG